MPQLFTSQCAARIRCGNEVEFKARKVTEVMQMWLQERQAGVWLPWEDSEGLPGAHVSVLASWLLLPKPRNHPGREAAGE